MKIIERMTLEEKCAQVIFVDYRFDMPDPERIVALTKMGVGGVCFFHGNMFELTPLINSLQNLAKHPMLMCADYEDGVGQHVSGATRLPSNMAVGATLSAELARLKGTVTGREAATLGVPWVLAPVVDLQSNPDNPVIGTRSFGEDFRRVTELARAFHAGLVEMRALGCLKHFPGHGDVAMDSHLELPVVEKNEAALQPYALFKDASAVMTGHLLARSWDAERPASLSPKVTGELLRKEIGFDGVVVTDALMMGGITKVATEPEALVQAVEAGADVLLYPMEPYEAPGILFRAVRSGRLNESRIDQSLERIFELKKAAGLLSKRIVDPSRIEATLSHDRHLDAACRIAERAITRVRDGKSLIPLTGKAAVVLVDGNGDGNLDAFRDELGGSLELVSGEPTPARPCVIGVVYRPRAFTGRAELAEPEVERVNELLKRVPASVLVSFGSPYILRQFPDVGTYVCAYGNDEATQRAVARALVDKIPFRGTLPVKLGV